MLVFLRMFFEDSFERHKIISVVVLYKILQERRLICRCSPLPHPGYAHAYPYFAKTMPRLTGFPLTSASACLSSFDSYGWSGGCAGGGAKFDRLHEDRCCGGGAGAGAAGAGAVDSAEDDSLSESEGDELPELGLADPIGERRLWEILQSINYKEPIDRTEAKRSETIATV